MPVKAIPTTTRTLSIFYIHGSVHRESNLTIVHQDATLFRWVKYIYFIHLPMKMELIESSETSAIRTQTQRNYPKENILHIEHSES